MLRRIGFRYADRVDPFDGGPHFTAPTDEVSLVQRAHTAKVARISHDVVVKNKSLVAIESKDEPYFRCVLADCAPLAADAVMLGEETASHLGVGVGDEVWVLPME
jgi:arginine N-succinyltransferase